MSIVGFKARNHPQQVADRGANDGVDTRVTPRSLWRQLDFEFGFTLDAAAAADNAKVTTFFDREADGLVQPWRAHRVWCNPPFSDLQPWVQKAAAEHAAGCPLIVMLLPANRTEQPWWHRYIEPLRDGRGPIETRFIKGRVSFFADEGKKERSSAPFGCVLVIWRAT